MQGIRNCKDVLKSSEVQSHLNDSNRWWSDYIFHFSHVSNIASILNNNTLLSREELDKFSNSTLNDNASQEVIDGTDNEFKDYVRFYFRPLTPTQFHNEGIRAKEEITNLNAHCPVPIFLLFDTAMLDDDDFYFSYESLASHYEISLHQGAEALINAPFHHIYHNESTFNLDGNTIRKRRHAEIITKKQCDLKYLKKIVCRNSAEAETLKDLLNENALASYVNKICIIGTDELVNQNYFTLFNPPHLQIVNVSVTKNDSIIYFNKASLYNRNLKVNWLDLNGKLICNYIKEDFILPNTSQSFNMLNFLDSHQQVRITVELDSCLVYSNKFNI